ncbi:MAG: DUF2339 domain-containing protein [Bacteroidales bacterium]|nr:DUF2339 domain-containing protein [Bacteroidales bacterium]
MNLDLSQNINLYLAIITSIISIILLIRMSNIGRNNKATAKTLRRLKYEITKMQDIDSKLFKAITNEEHETQSWIEEDEQKRLEKLERRNKRKQKFNTKFLELRNKLPKDLERFAGEQVLDKFGIGAFLIGLALFINLSMELEWINNFGRLFFGVSLTIILLLLGYIIRKKYIHFSNIIIGGGIASFIFAVFSAYYQYHLISLPIWLITTIFIIGSTIMISISVKRHEIAIITFIAAYLAPFTVNFITSDYIILFSYLTLLNLGILLYDYYQKSIVINLVSFGFTFMIYGIWLISKIYFKHEELPYLGAFLFLTLYYIMFLFIVIINNIREGVDFHKLDFSIMMAAKGIYLSVGMIIIKQSGLDYQGLFAGLIAVINYSFFLALSKRKDFDKRILNQFLGLSIMFFALIIPIEFYGKTITMVWALQAIVLMYVSVKSKLESMRMSSFFLTVAMVVSLLIDMYNQYLSTSGTLEFITPFFNRSFLSSMLAISSMISIFLLLPKDDEFFIKKLIKVKFYKGILGLFLVLISYFTFFLEIKTAAVQYYSSIDAVDTATSIYNLSFMALGAIPIFFKKDKRLEYLTIGMAFLAYALYIFSYSATYVDLRNEFLLSNKVTGTQFNMHYIAIIMLIFIVFSALKHIKVAFKEPSKASYAIMIILSFFAVYAISSEITNFYTVKLFEPHLLIQDIVKRLHHFSYSIAWAFASLFFITIGFLYKIQEIRIIAMFLYGLTLAKIILFDFWTATNQDLMISFAVMGVVMLISSFYFQLSKKSDKNSLKQKEETITN